MTDQLIYKVFTLDQWSKALITGTFNGAPIDITDGFIHFSTAMQVEETVAKHFFGQENLVLVSFDSEQFGKKLKWEISRGGDRFPHLYDVLDVTKARMKYDLEDLPDGRHRFPETY